LLLFFRIKTKSLGKDFKMKIEYAIKPNRNLKVSAQNIFGKNNVTEAYVCVNYYEHMSKIEHKQLLNQIQVDKS
jgi:hypothetical protein